MRKWTFSVPPLDDDERRERAYCDHGERVRVVGRGKSGRFWAALMCAERDEACSPEWIPDTEVYAFWRDSGGVGEASNALAMIRHRSE